MKTHRNKITAAGAILASAIVGLAWASEPAALELAKEGNRYVGEQSKDKLVQIRSDKSVGTLTPNIWYIVFYDPDATLKAVEVKFGAGKKLDVSHPLRLLEPVTGDDKILDRTKLKVDSDRALATASAEPLLKSLTLTASQFWLQRGDEAPVWKIRLWASKLRHPVEEVEIGDVYISTHTGEVVRRDLHIEKVN